MSEDGNHQAGTETGSARGLEPPRRRTNGSVDDTAARAALDLLEGQHRSAVALNARLEAERDNRPAIRWPDWDRLVIEARVAPNDIETIELGLEAQVRLTAYSQLGAPRLTGRVVRVSADRLADARTGMSWYEARVALDLGQPGLSSLALVPGMPAEVMIVTGARTPIDYLLTPIVESLGRALREE